MTTGSEISDNRGTVFAFGNPVRFGSYRSKIWSGSDRPKLSFRTTKYDRKAVEVVHVVPARPAQRVSKLVWKYRRVYKYHQILVDGFIRVRLGKGRPPLLMPAKVTKWVRVRTRERYRVEVYRVIPEKPAKVKVKRRWIKVAKPKPPKSATLPPENPYTMDYVRYSDALGTGSRRVWPYPDTNDARYEWPISTMTDLGGPGVMLQDWDANDEYVILNKLRKRLAGSDFNAGVFAGEAGKSCAMIANAARRIHQALYAVRRGDVVNAARALADGVDFFKKPPVNDLKSLRKHSEKTIASNWLELQYGWKPLLEDAKSGAEFLAHMHSVPRKQVYRVSHKKALRSTWDQNLGLRNKSFEAEKRVALKVTIRDASTMGLSGLLDPASVAWELMPYSFVVDWFVPIGAYLQNLALARSLDVESVVRTEFVRVKWGGCELRADRPFDPWMAYLDFGAFNYESVSLRRTAASTLNVPTPEVKSPAKIASMAHALNATALLITGSRYRPTMP
ncbi:maturation protein [ssRNA phage SRR5466725_14]|uniref:Maturation protein n=1 Tax=ssRNA phage SRR5466725_14 TaxID=2786412 RepID=A0A8S5L043_9VIRU|nr:maturation protein [ssRNA phage SRR5466725_14]DAD50819.1 TPA_asm: maturation protein [ssRNA phage SRR5466725_14]